MNIVLRVEYLIYSSIKASLSIRDRRFVFTHVHVTKTEVGMRFKLSLQIALSLHGSPEGNFIEFVIGDTYDGPSLLFQKFVFEYGVTQCPW